jgi:putative transposase
MIKAHKIRLHPTPEQANYFARAAGTARFTFNWAVAEWQQHYEAGGKPSALALRTHFNAIKKAQFPWVYEVVRHEVVWMIVPHGPNREGTCCPISSTLRG